MSKILINIITVVLMLSSFTFAVADNIAGDSNANNANNNSNSNVTNNAVAGASNSSLNKDRENIKVSKTQFSAQKGSNLTIKNAEQAAPSFQDQQPASQELQPRGIQGADNNANNKIILPSSSITNTRKGVYDELNNTDKLDSLDGLNVRDSNNLNNSNIAANNSNNNNNNNNVYGSKLNNDARNNLTNNVNQAQYNDQYNKQYDNKYNQDKLVISNSASPTVSADNSSNAVATNKVNNADNTNTGAATDNSNYNDTQSTQEKLFFKNRPRVITAPDDKISSLANNNNNNNINRANNKSDEVDSNTNAIVDKKIIGSSGDMNGDTTSKTITAENTQDLNKQELKPLKKSDDNTQEASKTTAKRDFSAQCFYELVPRTIFRNASQSQEVNYQNYLEEPLSLANYTKLLFINIKKDNIGVLNSLLNIIGTTEIKNSMGETPLTYAVKENKINSIRFLLTKKANIQAQNRGGQTALALANQLGNRTVIEALANSSSS